MLPLHQVLTAIYPAPPAALPTGVVSVAPAPPAVAPAAQDVMDPSSPLQTGMQGSAAATLKPYEAVKVKVEVKKENLLDGPPEDGGQELSSSAASSLLTINETAGNTPLVGLGFKNEKCQLFRLTDLNHNITGNYHYSNMNHLIREQYIIIRLCTKHGFVCRIQFLFYIFSFYQILY